MSIEDESRRDRMEENFPEPIRDTFFKEKGSTGY